MEIDFVTTSKAAEIITQLMGAYAEWYWCVAWGSENTLSNKLRPASKRLRKILFGTHFYQTDPQLLRRFLNHAHVRVAPSSGRTFHPKIYLFSHGAKRAALVGSNNFTMGGMQRNREAAVVLMGTAKDEIFRQIRQEVDNAWEESRKIDSTFLEWYERCHQATRRARTQLASAIPRPTPSRDARHPDLLDLDWADYARLLKSQKQGHLSERRAVIAEARFLFNAVPNFSQLSEEARKALAGFLGQGIKHRGDFKALDWGWFGRMQGLGTYKTIVAHHATRLDRAFRALPLQGEVTEEDYRLFAKLFIDAFSGRKPAGNYGTCSRLLAMKRPDQFLCVNRANVDGLAADLGFAKTRLDISNYWERVVIPLRQAKWWTSVKPAGAGSDLWESRMAMLDAIYYKP